MPALNCLTRVKALLEAVAWNRRLCRAALHLLQAIVLGYSYLLIIDMSEPLDPEYVKDRLSRHPFITVPGVVNIRDLGLYDTCYAGMITKPLFLFRSGEVSAITEEGMYRHPRMLGKHSARLTVSCLPQGKKN